MSKKTGIKYFMGISFVFFFAFISINNTSYSAKFYGSAKDLIFALNPGNSPVSGLPFSEVKEGYIYDGRKTILDTLSSSEKEKYGIPKHDPLIVVLYKSSYTGESSFEPGSDRFGNKLVKQFIELRYKYGNNKYFSLEAFDSQCIPLGDSPEDKKKWAEALWRKYYQENKAKGLPDEDIEHLWEMYKEQNPEKFQY